MTPAARERQRVRTPILLTAAAAWLFLIAGPGGGSAGTHCHAAVPASAFALSWAVMLVAMMGPLLIHPIRHVHSSSLTRRRARAICFFTAAYGAVWMAAGFGLQRIALVAAPFTSEAMASCFLAAAAWQCSPAKQRCLNRLHSEPPLPAFGPAADRGAAWYGVTHGLWCVASCSAIMLLPMLTAIWHLPAMAAATLWLCGEHVELPGPPRWAPRVPIRAFRIVAAAAVNGLRTALRSGSPGTVSPGLPSR